MPFGGIGPVELIVFAAVVLLVFGRRIPETARSVGRSIVEFRRGMRDVPADVENAKAMGEL